MSHEEHGHTTHEVHVEEQKKSNLFVRGAVIVAIILILLFIALTVVKFVPKLISSIGTANVSFSSLFNSKEKLGVSVNPAEVKTGNVFDVAWTNNTNTDGSLMWSYKCTEGITIEYNSISGQRPVVCETLFPLPTNTNSYSFVAKNSNKANTGITMTVALWDNDMKTVKAEGSTNLTVLAQGNTSTSNNNSNSSYEPDYNNPSTNPTNNNGGSNSSNTNTGNTNTNSNSKPTTGTNYPVNTGLADLQISLSNIGRTNSNGVFERTTSFAENDRVTMQFNVANIGTARSSNWSIEANLPSKLTNDRLFYSGSQPALNPGDSYLMTLSFDNFDPNARYITINVVANDYRQSNNTLSVAVSGNGSISNGGGNGSYNSTGSRADLTVRILDVGILGNNNQLRYSNSFDESDEIAVQFEVQNIGNTSTGSWRFEAELPTTDNDTYRSSSQQSLAPGERRIYTIGFDNPDTGRQTISITVDSDEDVRENKENNNEDSERIEIDD